jgi:hypothetical protein
MPRTRQVSDDLTVRFRDLEGRLAGLEARPVIVPSQGIIVAQFVATTNNGAHTVDTITDMVHTNVSVTAGHTYALSFHSNVLIGAGAGQWSILARVNGTAVGRYTEGLTVGSRDVDGTVYWIAPTTQATDDLEIFADETVDGSALTLQAGATAPRWFTVIDLGVL